MRPYLLFSTTFPKFIKKPTSCSLFAGDHTSCFFFFTSIFLSSKTSNAIKLVITSEIHHNGTLDQMQ
ncbi:hypothetical protein Hanom_Chr15g01359931 [Helianthus anomalus]